MEIIIRKSSDRSNIVLDLHTLFSELPIAFREYVCEECNWSIPTFYRKLRTKDVVNPENPEKLISAISKAEKDRIIEIGLNVFEEAGKYISKYSVENRKQ